MDTHMLHYFRKMKIVFWMVQKKLIISAKSKQYQQQQQKQGSTVKPRYSAFQGTSKIYALNWNFHNCQHVYNYKNISLDQIYTLY